jgi:diketogulonate reductase-like aldo/keto reductase
MISRRQFNQFIVSLGLATTVTPLSIAQDSSLIHKVIPKSGEKISAIGMGTWITFDKQIQTTDISQFVQILERFFQAGGQMIDSSPMYGFAQQFLGELLPKVNNKQELFSATKVWIPGYQMGVQQMQKSAELWGVDKFDLMHIHNMLDWKTHLKTLNEWKKEGRLKYSGITTSHGRRHKELIDMLKNHPVDFVQFTYNILDRKADNYLLPLAQDLGVAVVINRPFETGGLFKLVEGKKLPEWSKEIGCETWSQFFLKYIISHPAVTCAIPATSQLSHMQENMQALENPLPNESMREEMVRYFKALL